MSYRSRVEVFSQYSAYAPEAFVRWEFGSKMSCRSSRAIEKVEDSKIPCGESEVRATVSAELTPRQV